MIPDVDSIIDVSRKMLWMTFLLSMPVLLTALAIGVLISLVQTVTGVQEMTITFVPKLLAVMTVVALVMPWAIRSMTSYTRDLWHLMSSLPP